MLELTREIAKNIFKDNDTKVHVFSSQGNYIVYNNEELIKSLYTSYANIKFNKNKEHYIEVIILKQKKVKENIEWKHAMLIRLTSRYRGFILDVIGKLNSTDVYINSNIFREIRDLLIAKVNNGEIYEEKAIKTDRVEYDAMNLAKEIFEEVCSEKR